MHVLLTTTTWADSDPQSCLLQHSSERQLSVLQLLIPGLQESPCRKIPAYVQSEAWCEGCAPKVQALELKQQKIKAELEACRKGQGILKVPALKDAPVCFMTPGTMFFD